MVGADSMWRKECKALIERIARAEQTVAALSDPNRVHTCILRGEIALTKEQAIHIAGLPADVEERMVALTTERDALKAESDANLTLAAEHRDGAIALEVAIKELEADNTALRAQVARLSAPVSNEEWEKVVIPFALVAIPSRFYAISRKDTDALIAARTAPTQKEDEDETTTDSLEE
jgi:hypothetical protein